MSHGPEEINYGKKGSTVGWVAVYFILFIILLIWVYGQNQNGLPL